MNTCGADDLPDWLRPDCFDIRGLRSLAGDPTRRFTRSRRHCYSDSRSLSAPLRLCGGRVSVFSRRIRPDRLAEGCIALISQRWPLTSFKAARVQTKKTKRRRENLIAVAQRPSSAKRERSATS